MKRNEKIAAVALIVIGGFLVFLSQGYNILAAGGTLAMTPEGQAGVSVTSNLQGSHLFLSTVVPGSTYKWEVTAENTGNIDWDYGTYTLRISESGVDAGTAVYDSATHEEICGREVNHGNCMVIDCEYGADNINCRNGIVSDWEIEYNDDGNWETPEVSDRVAKIDLGSLARGETKTIDFRLTVPDDVSEDRWLVGNLQANVGEEWVVDYNKDQLSPGAPDGEASLEFVGGVSMALAGLALAGKRYI